MKDSNKIIVLLFLSSLIMFCSCQKEAKQFSLFSIVSFKQEECNAVSTSGLKGVCMTATECNSMSGGTTDGNCAAAFGVCCVVTVSACGSAITQNCSYIDNPSYPGTYSTTGDCSYTVTRCQDDICQIRLDFFSATLQQPIATTGITAGDCSDSILDITSGTTSSSFTNSPPNLCGTLTGQHVYVDSGRTATAATLKFTLGTSATNQWRIKVTQIECWNPSKAPEDCLQYFYGAHRHTVTSFNWDGSAACSTGCNLSDQQYRACFRAERGSCSQTITQTAVSTSEDSFHLGVPTGANMANELENAEVGGSTCTHSYLLIHSVNSKDDDRYCGDYLNSTDQSEVAGAVNAQSSNAFQFTVVAREQEADEVVVHAGFSLDVQQTACGQSTFGNSQADGSS